MQSHTPLCSLVLVRSWKQRGHPRDRISVSCERLFPFYVSAHLTFDRSTSGESSHLFIYSLRTHEIIKKLAFPGLVSFAATDRFIVVVSPRHQSKPSACLPPLREHQPLDYTLFHLRTLYYYSPFRLLLLRLFHIPQHHTATAITTTNSTIPL